MKFPNIQDLDGYADLLAGQRLRGRWPPRTPAGSPPASICT